MTTSTPLSRRNPVIAVLGVLALLLAVFFLVHAAAPKTYTLRLGAADPLSRNHTVALALSLVARKHGLEVIVVTTKGSVEELTKVDDRTFDIAMIQGGLVQDNLDRAPHVRQVASLATEALHLLVRPQLRALGLNGLRGHPLNLGAKGSGTRALVRELLQFVGLRPGADYTDECYDYAQLEALPPAKLPDGIFLTSLLPSPLAEFLISKRGYCLLDVPLKEALSQQVYGLQSAEIPAFTYGVMPPAPPQSIHTIGTRFLLIANERTPPEAVSRLLETLYGGEFARMAKLAPSPESSIGTSDSEFPLHAGTLSYLRRDDPPITSTMVSVLENLRSFLASMALGFFLLWRWYVRCRSLTFAKYLHDVTHLERQALRLELEPVLDLAALLKIRQRVSQLKSEALEKYPSGELKGDELMMGFLAHVTDVRTYLNGLILYQRDRLEDQAKPGAAGGNHAARFQQDWREALGDFSLRNDPAERQGSD